MSISVEFGLKPSQVPLFHVVGLSGKTPVFSITTGAGGDVGTGAGGGSSSSSSRSNASAPSRRQPATALFFRKWKKSERSFFVAPLFCLPPSPYSHLPRPDERTNLALRGVHCTFLAAAPSSSCRSHHTAMQPASNPPSFARHNCTLPHTFLFPSLHTAVFVG